MSDFKLDTTNLDNLIAALKEDSARVVVGVLGAKSNRKNVKIGNTNASIGAIHEFGTATVPQRSFLRQPISERLNKELEQAQMFGQDELKQIIKEKSFTSWLKRLGALGERIVIGAFNTGGYGKWAAWKTPGYKNEGNRLLVDTRQLRDSITSEVR